MQKILVTGSAGFIGFHITRLLAKEGYTIIGLDNINNYYSVDLKRSRLATLGFEKAAIIENTLVESTQYHNLHFIKADLQNEEVINNLFKNEAFDTVIHLAAQAGVRHSLKAPRSYVNSNISGYLNILEGSRNYPVRHLIYASSSSVYGSNNSVPYSTKDNVDHPASLYAATKKSNELMAHAYSSLYKIPTTGLRFFTVYGPWGRPDMAYFLFTDAILNGEAIKVFNNGKMKRDFTYIDDVVECIKRLIPKPPSTDKKTQEKNYDPSTSFAPYRIFNIGNSNPVKLMTFIKELEKKLGSQVEKKMMEMQPGDLVKTWADVGDLFNYINFKPKINLSEGIQNFIDWYKKYHQLSDISD